MGILKDWIKSMVGTTFQLNTDDIVVLLSPSVVGPSGSGKSSFIEAVTKSGLISIGGSLKPCTTKVQAIRFELAEEARLSLGATILQKNIVFVDTPSFHAEENDKAEKEMNNWLTKSKSKSTLLGAIYVHRVETPPADEPVRNHIDTFAYAFPEGFAPLPQRLRAVLSYEGTMSSGKTKRHEQEFQPQLDGLWSRTRQGRLLWQTSLHPNFFQQGDSEIAWQAVVGLFSHSA